MEQPHCQIGGLCHSSFPAPATPSDCPQHAKSAGGELRRIIRHSMDGELHAKLEIPVNVSVLQSLQARSLI